METTLDIGNEVAVITGGTAGIGQFTATELARHGARVIIVGRDAARARSTAMAIRKETGKNVEFVLADLSTVDGNLGLAAQLHELVDRVDILVNNVGGVFERREVTDDGIEATIAMNLVGPFALTNELIPLLRRSARPRVINVSSSAHRLFRHDLRDPESHRSYVGLRAYSAAKYYNLLWSYSLARKLRQHGIKVNAVEPGPASSPTTESMSPKAAPWYWRPFWPIVDVAMKMGPASEAARSTVRLATSLEGALLTGEYFDSAGRVTQPTEVKRDLSAQDGVWALAESLVARASMPALAAA